ncbi:methionyl-tRNA formyltransferase [Nesterenkonia sp. F]|uniref:methionyl-tRNA formyltransferase n=1 Tax=Nesterenkonia sp. F TaxID=795955 RepID=UPI000255CEB0|nr:methionyl-tRNA formyltransferase [Nesterenkonia sp. F]
MQHHTETSLADVGRRIDPAASAAGSILFAGTPQIAADCLTGLLAAGVDVAAVLTRPDAPVGRRRRMTPSPVAQIAEEAGIPVIRASRVDEEVSAAIGRTGARLGVAVAYGALLPQHALDAPEHGWVNLHYSRLPAHRGASPVPHAVLDGDVETAATVFQIEAGMDTGPIHGVCPLPISEEISSGELLDELTAVGTRLLIALLPDLLAGRSVPEPQVGEATYAPKLTREDAFIDPRHPAAEVVRRINATTPEPGPWTLLGETRLKLGTARPYEAETPDDIDEAPVGAVLPAPEDRPGAGPVLTLRAGDGRPVVLRGVQPAGKQMMDPAAWHRGLRETPVLGTAPAAEDVASGVPSSRDRSERPSSSDDSHPADARPQTSREEQR